MKKIILCLISGLLIGLTCFADTIQITWPTGHVNDWYVEGLRYGNCYYITCYNNGNIEDSDFRQSIWAEQSNLCRLYGVDEGSGNFPEAQFMLGIRTAAKNLQQNFDSGYVPFPSGVSLPTPAKPFKLGFDYCARGNRDGLIYMMAGTEADTIASDCKSFYWNNTQGQQSEDYINSIGDVCPDLENKIKDGSSVGITWPTGHNLWYAEGLRYGNCYYITCYNNGNTENLDFYSSIWTAQSNLCRLYGVDEGSGNFPEAQFMLGIRTAAKNLQQNFDSGYTPFPSGVSLPSLTQPFPTGFGLYVRGYRDGMIYMMAADPGSIESDCSNFYTQLYKQGNPQWTYWISADETNPGQPQEAQAWIVQKYDIGAIDSFNIKKSSDQLDEYLKGIKDSNLKLYYTLIQTHQNDTPGIVVAYQDVIGPAPLEVGWQYAYYNMDPQTPPLPPDHRRK